MSAWGSAWGLSWGDAWGAVEIAAYRGGRREDDSYEVVRKQWELLEMRLAQARPATPTPLPTDATTSPAAAAVEPPPAAPPVVRHRLAYPRPLPSVSLELPQPPRGRAPARRQTAQQDEVLDLVLMLDLME